MKNKFVIILVAVLAVAAGMTSAYFWLNHSKANSSANSKPVAVTAAPEKILGQTRPPFSLNDLNGKSHSISEWDGQVVLINFWASWCPPCVKEMPALLKLREQYHSQGFEIVGVALDNKDAVSAFIDPMGIDYPVLMAEQEGLGLAQQYGNHLGVLPYTVIVDRQGVIRHTIVSELTFEQVEILIKPLLATTPTPAGS